MQAVNPDYIINNILDLAATMEGFEEQQRLNNLKLILYMSMNGIKIYRDDNAAQLPDVYVDKTKYVVKQFLSYLEENGRTKSTVLSYQRELVNFFSRVNKSYKDVKHRDVRAYLAWRRKIKDNNDVTINTKIHVLNSFYNFIMRYGNSGEDESEEFDYFYDFEPPKRNPMDRIEVVKTEHKYKGIFEDEEITRIQDECKKLYIENNSSASRINMRKLESKRNLAIIDLLLSSGMRVGEMVELDIKDIKFNERECLVYGKGRKERPVYMNGQAKVHIKEYLALRKELCGDMNPALFIWSRKPYERLSSDGVRRALNDIGKRINVQINPHKFRRTFATRLLESGVPLDVVSDLMGHSNVNTTKQCYTKYSKQRVKNAYRQAMTV